MPMADLAGSCDDSAPPHFIVCSAPKLCGVMTVLGTPNADKKLAIDVRRSAALVTNYCLTMK
jgi:hypothetical protein